MPYSQTVLEHFEHPRNAGAYAGPPAERISGAGGERRRGARVEFDLQVRGGRVIRAWFRAYGCPHTIAAASWVAEWLTDRPLAAAAEVRAGQLAEVLDLPAEKLGRMLVIEDALAECLAADRQRGTHEGG